MRKHLFFGRGKYVHKRDIQAALNSLSFANRARPIAESRKYSAAGSFGGNGMKSKKISPLKFKF